MGVVCVLSQILEFYWHRQMLRSTPKRCFEFLGYASCLQIKEDNMTITCFIEYQIDPTKKDQFEQYAQNWGQAIPRCGAELVGYFAPHEGSSTLAYGVYHIESLAHYERYRARLQQDPLGKANYAFAQEQKFLLQERRTFLKLVSSPHANPEYP